MLTTGCLIVLLTVGSYAILPLPHYIKACVTTDATFVECALQHGNEAIPYIVKGDRSYKIMKMDPMNIAEIQVRNGPRQAGLFLTMRDLELHGLKNAVLLKSDFNFDKRHFSHNFQVPLVRLTGKYSVSGKVLLLPIFGNGDMNVTMVNNTLSYSYDWDLKQMGDYRHMILKNSKAEIKPSRAFIHLSNLFDGDKLLGNQINGFLTENWQELFRDIGPTVAGAISEAVTSVVNGISKEVPYDDIFPASLP
ncbi:protein takeout-like [Zootermopsis nevadensis]|uniref:Protein takeout n=1 Tax=Zootermopsis nevadensis TaxID=136037 RepID=A0A067RGE9_ZOONE|nr:protein takeout-like [Zootermopsis nevadensis]KDR22098.1 Protein takeout [Zootermopsis nevadensis]